MILIGDGIVEVPCFVFLVRVVSALLRPLFHQDPVSVELLVTGPLLFNLVIDACGTYQADRFVSVGVPHDVRLRKKVKLVSTFANARLQGAFDNVTAHVVRA